MSGAPIPTYTLNDGSTIPAIGFGTYPLRGEEGVAAIRSAIEIGYRLIDTAVNYENEDEVGRAIRTSGVHRDDILIATKIPGRDHAYDRAIASVEESLRRLDTDRIDLGLIHWPNPNRGLYPEAWRALVDLQQRGLVRTIGVSNFHERHLTTIIEQTGVTPAVNQLELHPLFPQEEMRAVDRRLGIRTEAWSPLGKRQAQYDAPAVSNAAAVHGVTPAQVILRWQVELGVIPIPKSADPQRQKANLDIFGFSLDPEEIVAISALGRPDGRLFDGDPETHEEL